MKTVVHVSNRVVVPKPGTVQSGGLDEVLAHPPEGTRSIRIGWNGQKCNNFEEARASIETHTVDNTTYIVFSLPEDDFDGFYNVISNGLLWPAMHDRVDIATGYAPFGPFSSGIFKRAFEQYEAVNAFFASVVKDNIQDAEKILVHDYHLFSVGKKLKEEGVTLPTGFFLHIPAPSATTLESIREPALQNCIRGLLKNLYSYDLVGCQSARDLRNIASIIGNNPDIANLYETTNWENPENGQKTKFGAFPVAGNYPLYIQQAEHSLSMPETRDFVKRIVNGSGRIGIFGGGQRLDYTKGLAALAYAVGDYLTNFGQKGEKLSLLQIAPRGRMDVPAYVHETGKVEGAFEMLKAIGCHATLHEESVDRKILLGMARLSDVIAVTPLRDGFNLAVAELLVAMPRENPGAVILSKFAGAAEIIGPACLLVDPADRKSFAKIINKARAMTLDQRQDNHGRGLEILKTHTGDRWHKSISANLG